MALYHTLENILYTGELLYSRKMTVAEEKIAHLDKRHTSATENLFSPKTLFLPAVNRSLKRKYFDASVSINNIYLISKLLAAVYPI